MAKECSTFGCWYPVFSKGLCQTHWRQNYGKSIKKFTGLKQTEGETTAKPFKVKKAIKNVSPGQLKRLAEYRKARDEHFKEFPTCQYPECTSTKVQLHHSRGRIGELLTDKRYFKSLCFFHHRIVEESPLEAKKLKLSFDRL